MKKLLASVVMAFMVTSAVHAKGICWAGAFDEDGELVEGADEVLAGAVVFGVTSAAVDAVVGNIASGITGSVGSMGGGLAMDSKLLTSVDGMAAVATQGYNCGWELWANPLAVWTSDFYGDIDTYGFNIAVQKHFNIGKLGLVAGYAHSNFDATNEVLAIMGETDRNLFDVHHYTVAAYGDFNIKNFGVTAILGNTWNRFHDFGDDNEKIHGNAFFTALKVGYDFHVASAITITPSVGWRYTYTRTRDLGGNMEKDHNSKLPFLVKVAYQSNIGKLYVEGGYIRELRGHEIFGQSVIQNDRGTIGAGFEGETGRFLYGVDYNYGFDTRDYDSHYLGLKFGIRF